MPYKRRQMSDVEYYRRDINKRVIKIEKILKALDQKLERRIKRIETQRFWCACGLCQNYITTMAEGDSEEESLSVVTGGSV